DWTMYGTTVASQHAGKVIEVLGDAIRNAKFRAQDFQAERPLIMEEIQGVQLDPERAASAILFRNAFQRHPYARDSRGSPAGINGLNLEAVRAYFQKYYVPSSTPVVVGGDVAHPAVEKQVQAAFAADQPGANKPPYQLPAPETACEKPRREVLE